MVNSKTLFLNVPDTVFVTDMYGYILDFNRLHPFDTVRKGRKITSLIPDSLKTDDGEVRIGGGVYRRRTMPILYKDNISGYTVMLTDVTEEADITEKRRKTSEDLKALADTLKSSNGELESLVLQTKQLTDYAEQLRIAQTIHDDAGHAITELHTICQMCLKLRDSDPKRYGELLNEGIEICRRSIAANGRKRYDSLKELLDEFAHMCRLRTDISVRGSEPPFLREKYGLIKQMLKEAYHNTLDHSFADTIQVSVDLSENSAKITILDNGSFRGGFEKGFGLSVMEERVIASGGEIAFIAESGRGFEIKAEWRMQK
ncbi:MAG: hypothetical protein J6112_06615 [Clostridia bacterium]|nr:hypothetical protein [Clostridia bacterium]